MARRPFYAEPRPGDEGGDPIAPGRIARGEGHRLSSGPGGLRHRARGETASCDPRSPPSARSEARLAIFLIRHGETRGNAERIVQVPDIPLSARGAAQAERLARRLAAAGIARILSSDLARAAMTAERLRLETGASLDLDPLLQERNFGDIRGTPYAELGFDPFVPEFEPPRGESWPVFHARVERAWALVQAVAARTEGHLAVVTHGLVCRSLAERHLLLPPGAAAPLTWPNTSLTIADGPAPWRVRLLNCVSHLEGLDGIGPALPGEPGPV